MKVYSLANHDLTPVVNDAVDIFLRAMYNDNVLTKEQVDACSKYRVVIAGRKYWGNLWGLFKSDNPERDAYYIVKPIDVDNRSDSSSSSGSDD